MQYPSQINSGRRENNELVNGHYLPLTIRSASTYPLPEKPDSWNVECQNQAQPIWGLKTFSYVEYPIASASLQGSIRQNRILDAIFWTMEMCKTDSHYDITQNKTKFGKGFNNYWTRVVVMSCEDVGLANTALVILAAQSLNYSFSSYLEGENAAINMTIMLARSIKSRATDWACICRIRVPESEVTRQTRIFDNSIYYNKLGENLLSGNHLMAIGYAECFIIQSLHDKDNKVTDPLPKAEFERLSTGIYIKGNKIKHYKNRRQLIWTALFATLNHLRSQGRQYPCVLQIVEACYELSHCDKFRWDVESRLFGRMAILSVCLRDEVEGRGLSFKASPITEMPYGRDFTPEEIINLQHQHRVGNFRTTISNSNIDKHSKLGKSLGRDIQHFIEVKAFLRHEDPALMELSDYYLKMCMHARYCDYNNPNGAFDKSGITAQQYADWIPQLRSRINRLNQIEDAMLKQTITITFGDRGESHYGMQMLSGQENGGMAPEGFSIQDLAQICYNFRGVGVNCEFYNLNEGLIGATNTNGTQIVGEPAAILILRNVASRLITHSVSLDQNISKLSNGLERVDETFVELISLNWDNKMYSAKHKKIAQDGTVINPGVVSKHARHNLCFADFHQDPDFANKKGTVIAWNEIPFLESLRNNFSCFGPKASDLIGEGNLYYDVKTCGIGYHGDKERRIVIALRLGASMPICFQWYYNGDRIGRKMTFIVNHSDLYIMSSKAVGQDSARRVIPTLRHAAGCDKYTK